MNMEYHYIIYTKYCDNRQVQWTCFITVNRDIASTVESCCLGFQAHSHSSYWVGWAWEQELSQQMGTA